MATLAKNVYILGTAYCGSTILGNALNAHPKMAYAGEISRLPAFGVGAPETECPPCASLKKKCPVWTKRLIEEVQEKGPGHALELYRKAVDVPIIIEGSKFMEWLRKVHASEPLPPHTAAIVSIRNPFAYAHSVRRRDGFPAWRSANTWRDTVFDMFRGLGQMNIPFMVVRYEDFALNPAPMLVRICHFLGIKFDKAMMKFWDYPVHAIGGNAGAYVWHDKFRGKGRYMTPDDAKVARGYQKRKFGGWVDDKWQGQFSRADVENIVNTPMINDMCSLVGYNLA